MEEKRKKKMPSISEEDAYAVMQRYGPATILTLLQEIYQLADDVKIDWKALVKRSSTGISNAREYQMLWRHLAYHHKLVENVDGEEPLDDDSDLEIELEAVTAGNAEISSQAAACVKVLLPSGLPCELGFRKGFVVEAPLTAELSNGQASHSTPRDEKHLALSASGKSIAVPAMGPSAEGLDGNETMGSGLPSKKKRKHWTDEEDTELIAAVQKHGEGNWASILKGDFKHDRTASQLSQRWSTIKKRMANANPGGSSNNSSNLTQSETLLATRQAVANALKMPMVGSSSAIFPGATQPKTTSDSSIVPATLAEAPAVPSHQASNLAAPQSGLLIPLNKKPKTTTKNSSAPPKPLVSPNPMIQAAAFAAGGRIAAPSTAASLFKAANSKNVVHIIPSSKQSVKGGKLLSAANRTSAQPVGFRPARPFMMPPPPGKRATSSNGTKSGGLRARFSSAITLAQPATSSKGSSERNGALLVEEVRGGDEMELDGVAEKDNQRASFLGDKDSNVAISADKMEENS